MQFIIFKMENTLLKIKILSVLLLALFLLPAGPVSIAHASELVRLNIAAFEKRDAAFEFESIITGTHAQMFEQMQGKSDVIFFNRTPVLMDKDVINLQLDALRMSKGALANGGLNCQFSFDNESDEDSQFYSIAGMCTLMHAEADGTRKVRAYVKRTMLSDVSYGMNVWMKVYEDKAEGIAIYADVDPK